MKNLTRLLVIAFLALSFAACKKEEAPKVDAVKAPMAMPTTEDVAAWRDYVTDVATRNMDGINNSPYVYFLPGEGSETFGGDYERLLEKLEQDLSRGIIEGNMLLFGSPARTKLADLVEASFKDAKPNTMKNVKVIFVGDAADKDRVQAAVAPSGVTYVFVESK